MAEEPDHYVNKIPAGARRVETGGFTILFGPGNAQSVTSRVRTTAEGLDATIAEVRRTLREAGCARNVWQVGPSCRPAGLGLGRMLLERGFERGGRPPFEAAATAMVLAKRPAITATGIEVRLVRNIDEYREAVRIAMAAFNESPEDAAKWLEAVPSFWAAQDGVNMFTHLAFLDGRPVGMGFAAAASSGVLLGGSGVLESARGRGVYRALIAARWEEAVRLGHEGLIIHAGSMSRPILERCGFEAVCDIEIFEDSTLQAS
jgi:GNAT superfamily N-acetyltransferase